MIADARKLVDKAQRAIATAVRLKDDDPDFALARAYYAMFYAAEALLLDRGLRFRKHGAIHAAFGEQFIKKGILEPKVLPS
ncbi:MAG: HEPN domain-containing protein [Acidobacteria bacterium]|nr:HEPN domain-containing protein [Acidobacteriota bacterium]